MEDVVDGNAVRIANCFTCGFPSEILNFPQAENRRSQCKLNL
jgi:hypothetical protein